VRQRKQPGAQNFLGGGESKPYVRKDTKGGGLISKKMISEEKGGKSCGKTEMIENRLARRIGS